MNLTKRWCFTETPAYDSLEDLANRLAFLERTWWGQRTDLNDLEYYQRYSPGRNTLLPSQSRSAPKGRLGLRRTINNLLSLQWATIQTFKSPHVP